MEKNLLEIKQPRDPQKVNVNEAWELNYWSQKFGVSAAQLHIAVSKVGTRTKNVERYLGR
jgi:hypothetical protein